LRTLHLDITSSSRLFDSIIFFTPTLHGLTVTTKAKDYQLVDSFIHQIQHLAFLREISISGCFSRISGLLAMAEALKSCITLEKVTFKCTQSVTRTLFGILSQLPILERVAVTYGAEDDEGVELTIAEVNNGFPALNELHLDQLDLGFLPDLLTSRSLDTLTALSLNVWTQYLPPESYRSADLFKAIARTASRLKVLKVIYGDGLGEEDPLTYEVIKPITILPLQLLHITHDYPLALHEAHIVDLSQALGSTLISLDLNHQPHQCRNPMGNDQPNHTGHLRLTALVPLAKHCPHLEELSLFIDARFPPNEPIESMPAFPNALRELHFGTSPINNPHSFIRMLNTATITRISGRQIKIRGVGTGWSHVEAIVDLLNEQGEGFQREIADLQRRIRGLEAVIEDRDSRGNIRFIRSHAR
jgi:hypothetical protein